MPSPDRLQLLREGCARFVRASGDFSTPRIMNIVGPVTLAAVSAGLFLILSEAGSTPAMSQGTGELRGTQTSAQPTAAQAAEAALGKTAPTAKADCKIQQWPYVDERCAKQNGQSASSKGMRKVRVIGQDGKSRIIMSARPDLTQAKAGQAKTAQSKTAQAAPKPAATKSEANPAPLTPLDYKAAKTETPQADPKTTEKTTETAAASNQTAAPATTIATLTQTDSVPLPREKPEAQPQSRESKPEIKPAVTQTASRETTASAPANDDAPDASATHRDADRAAEKAEKKAAKAAKVKRDRAAKVAARAAREKQAARKRNNLEDAVAVVRSLPDQSDSRRVTVRYSAGYDDRDGFSRVFVVPAGSSETW